jgi:hypothetical protein
MHKRYLILLVVLALTAPAAQADIIHLKNGSVLKGKVASFSDDQFIVMLDTGSGRYLSRAMVYVGDVARIEFEGAPSSATDGAMREAPSARSTDTPSGRPTDTGSRDTSGRDTSGRDTSGRDTSAEARDAAHVTVTPDLPRNTPPERPTRNPETTDTQPVTQPSEAPAEKPQPEKPAETKPTRAFDRPADIDKPTASTATEAPPAEPERPTSRKLAGQVRTATIDVIGKRDWTSTGLIVKRGDRIRINASGAVTLDPTTGRTTGPEGAGDLADAKKLMADQPTGALIGVIGADNDDFIFIGKTAEFTATRDGLLFLSVNEGNLADNLGTFKAVIEVQSQKK